MTFVSSRLTLSGNPLPLPNSQISICAAYVLRPYVISSSLVIGYNMAAAVLTGTGLWAAGLSLCAAAAAGAALGQKGRQQARRYRRFNRHKEETDLAVYVETGRNVRAALTNDPAWRVEANKNVKQLDERLNCSKALFLACLAGFVVGIDPLPFASRILLSASIPLLADGFAKRALWKNVLDNEWEIVAAPTNRKPPSLTSPPSSPVL